MSLIRYQTPQVTNWSPFDRLLSFRDELDSLFNFGFPATERNGGLFSGWSPALDVYQDKDNVFVKVELPGLQKDEIDISLHDGVLAISGERQREEKAGEGESFRSERYVGRFHRSVTLPAGVQGDKVTATYTDGVLAVTLPKAEEAKPKRIEVSVS